MTTENQSTDTTQAPATTAEPSMAEYAAAISRGNNPLASKPAAAVEPAPVAAATEEDSAAATNKDTDNGKTTTASATEDEVSKEIEDAHPAKKGIQKRFSEMTAKQKEIQAKADAAEAARAQAAQEAAEAKAELERMRQAAAEAAQAAIPVVPDAAEDPAPQRDTFDDPDEYVAALSAYTTRQEIRRANEAAQENARKLQQEVQQAEQARKQEAAQAEINQLHKVFHERVTAAKTDLPDYDEKVTNNTDLVMRNDVFFTIEKSDMAPYLLHHIATNPELAGELNNMHPIDVALRLGELQAEIKVARKPKPSKAAEPVKPVGNRASPQAKSPNEETMDEYAARMEQEAKAARAGRSVARRN